ncbi:MAG: aldo/keto reductase [Rhodospirillales bacterium]|tara:strand:+ start:350 stop:1207 length:858 start_codon:yes stop_codon:yes gene_type:complete
MDDAGTIDIDGVAVPRLLYGTAWKEDATERLVTLALEQGFRGFDTANQRKHYYEAGTGAALAKAVKAGRVRRADLFIQTKFTFRRGQDHRLPYDENAPAATQVVQSFEKSLEHLQTDYIDSLVLHGPWTGDRLHPIDWQVWRAMEAIHEQGRVRLLGVSNFKLEQVRLLCARAAVKPRFVQNRCYASRGWDRDIRAFCAEAGIRYQGFSLLTANRALVDHALVKDIAAGHGKTPAQTVFRFALDVGMIALTGTKDAAHMAQDLDVFDFTLSTAEIHALERAGTSN